MPDLRPAALSQALGLFDHDDDGNLFLGGNFGALKTSLAVNSKNSNSDINNHWAAHVSLRAAAHDIWNIAAIVERLEWMRNLAIQQELPESWRTYAKLDVSHIIYEFRSIFDHVACAAGSLSARPGTIPESFERLIKNREKHQAILGAMYDSLNRDFTWFYDLRVMRTAIVHRGSEPLVFCSPKDGLLFQVHGRNHENLIFVPEFMYNSNVVRFEPYAAYYFAEMLSFLEDFATAAMGQIEFPLPMTGVRNYCLGYQHLVRWMENLLERLIEAEI
ncbi:hypothetical protein [Allochromatium vinosum]|uniref:hypothetical protein n=1 Tax=Allochromatium vinosum TaxID=1049 RepID=UPI00190670EF|nr:hypothetical protein [Allochromatium vinosum]